MYRFICIQSFTRFKYKEYRYGNYSLCFNLKGIAFIRLYLYPFYSATQQCLIRMYTCLPNCYQFFGCFNDVSLHTQRSVIQQKTLTVRYMYIGRIYLSVLRYYTGIDFWFTWAGTPYLAPFYTCKYYYTLSLRMILRMIFVFHVFYRMSVIVRYM